MLLISKNHSHFKRLKNVLIEVLSTGEEIPVLTFKQKFPDVDKFKPQVIEYMNNYIEKFPELIEEVKTGSNQGSSSEQLTLF
jgi:hypothetical protein